MLRELLSRQRNLASLVFCLVFSFVCILWQGNPFVRSLAHVGDVMDVVGGALRTAIEAPGLALGKLEEHGNLHEKYRDLVSEMQARQTSQGLLETLRAENKLLRETLNLAPSVQYPHVHARVWGMRLNTISPRILVGAGEAKGVGPFMPVLARARRQNRDVHAVAGLVAWASSRTSVVQPLVHPDFRLGVRLQKTGEWAVVRGNSGVLGGLLLEFRTVEAGPKDARIIPAPHEPGLLVYTSGDGGVFPPGIPVGVVGTRTSGDSAVHVEPLVRLDRLDIVVILKKNPADWREDFDKPVQLPETLR